eukprot:gene5485-5936_t
MRVFAFVRNELLPFVRRRALLTSSSFEVDLWFDTCQVRGLDPDGEGCAAGEPDADAEAATDAAPPPKNGNGTPAGAVSESAPPPSPSAAQTEAKPGPASPSGLPPTAPNTREGLPRGQGAKQRFHKLSKHQMAEARSAAARGEAAAGAPPGAAGQPHAAQPIPPELILAPPLALSTPLSVILARRPHPMARANAARALQFDLLLSSTKYRRRALLAKRFGEYVIPLFMLVTSGQVFNGQRRPLFSSLLSDSGRLWLTTYTLYLLHRVPSMRPEMHHVLLIAAGALHTILCATKSQLHAHAHPDACIALGQTQRPNWLDHSKN